MDGPPQSCPAEDDVTVTIKGSILRFTNRFSIATGLMALTPENGWVFLVINCGRPSRSRLLV
jgi:hypothetical protein